jgi:hypothetical protein
MSVIGWVVRNRESRFTTQGEHSMRSATDHGLTYLTRQPEDSESRRLSQLRQLELSSMDPRNRWKSLRGTASMHISQQIDLA